METSLVGSYPQPEWLVDREKLRGRLPPRVRASDIWKIDPDQLADAQDAATLAAIRDQERAGLDIVTDGEIRRESYSNYFVLALDGIDVDQPGEALDRNGNPMPVPRVAGPITRRGGSILVATPSSCAAPPTARSRSRCPGRSRWPSRPRTTTTDRRGGRVRVRRRGPAGGARAVRGRRGHRPARRAVDGVTLRAGPRVRDRDPPPRAGRRPGTTVLHICFGYPLFVPGHKRTYRFLGELAQRPWTRSRSRRRRPSST